MYSLPLTSQIREPLPSLDDEGMVGVKGDVAQGPLGEEPGGLLKENGFFASEIRHDGLQGVD